MKKTITYTKLCTMMFLQFMLFAVFFQQLAAYLENIKVSAFMTATIMATLAWGSLLSPIVGMVADRLMSGEKVLALLNVTVAVFLFLAGWTDNHVAIFVCLFVAMCAYMPTWSITSAIAMAHANPDNFPFIRVFGTIGWVCAAVFAIGGKFYFDISIDGTNIPLYCGAGVSAVAAVFALALPSTPPPAKGKPMSIIDALGLRAFGMLKDRNLAIFMCCTCLRTFLFAMYYLYFSQFLKNGLKIDAITATISVGQVVEIACLLILPFFVKYLGLKYTMFIGLLALAVRYLFCMFSLEVPGLYWGAIAMQGLIFGCFIVGAQIYMRRKAPKDMISQAQGLFFCLTEGFGLLIGAYAMKALISYFVVDGVVDWKTAFTVVTAASVALAIGFLVFFKDKLAEKGAE